MAFAGMARRVSEGASPAGSRGPRAMGVPPGGGEGARRTPLGLAGKFAGRPVENLWGKYFCFARQPASFPSFPSFPSPPASPATAPEQGGPKDPQRGTSSRARITHSRPSGHQVIISICYVDHQVDHQDWGWASGPACCV